MTNIVICAPATPITRDHAAAFDALIASDFPGVTATFHDQCFASQGHFAGDDLTRLTALLECANDPAFGQTSGVASQELVRILEVSLEKLQASGAAFGDVGQLDHVLLSAVRELQRRRPGQVGRIDRHRQELRAGLRLAEVDGLQLLTRLDAAAAEHLMDCEDGLAQAFAPITPSSVPADAQAVFAARVENPPFESFELELDLVPADTALAENR